jgi:hypothetical protein
MPPLEIWAGRFDGELAQATIYLFHLLFCSGSAEQRLKRMTFGFESIKFLIQLIPTLTQRNDTICVVVVAFGHNFVT